MAACFPSNRALGSMDDIERGVLQRSHHHLTVRLEQQRCRPKVLDLFAQKIKKKRKWQKKKITIKNISAFLDNLPKRCSMRLLFQILKTNQDPEMLIIVETMEKDLRMNKNLITIKKTKLEQNEEFEEYNNTMAHKYQVMVYNVQGGCAMAVRSNFEKELKEVRKTQSDGTNNPETDDRLFALINALLDTERTYMSRGVALSDSPKFEELETNIPKTRFPAHAETVYLSRLAAARGVDGDVDGAIHTARKSLDMIDLEYSSRGNVNVIYSFINNLLIVYEKKMPVGEIKAQLLGWIETGLQQVQNLNPEIRQLWESMLLVKKAFVLLGLGNSSKKIEKVDVSDIDAAKANAIIQELRTSTWDNIDRRRKMLVCIAEARIAKNAENSSEYNRHILEAHDLAKDTFGREFEILKIDVESSR